MIRSYKSKRKFKKKRKSIFKKRVFWDTILFFILACSIFYFLFLSPIFKIREIKISTFSNASQKELENIVEKELNKNFLWFFQKNSLFLANIKNIEKEILARYPEIEEATLGKKFPSTLCLDIKKRKAVAKYRSADNWLLLDTKGILFRGSTSEDLPEISLKSDKFKNPGERIISEQKMNQILKIKNQLREKIKVEPVEFYLKAEDRLDVKTADGWEIYFDLSDDVNLALTKLQLLLEREVPEEKRGILQYIDLRFTKVFYK